MPPKLPQIPEINFERFVSRSVAKSISDEMDLAGVKLSVNRLIEYTVLPAVLFLVIVGVLVTVTGNGALLGIGAGIGSAVLVVAFMYFYIEYRIDKRKSRLEAMLPDFFQIVAANLRSGISLERAMLLAARPEFSFLSDDVKEMARRVFGGQTLEASLQEFAARYRSYQLRHAIRMIMEALRYGGAMADLIAQIAKDIRNQQLIQKEIAGQLMLYTIFVLFAGLVVSPGLFGLTSRMLVITSGVWNGILTANPGGLPVSTVSFLKLTPPQITPAEYQEFSYAAVIVITGFASLIVSAIQSGVAIRGLRYMPIFIIIGIVLYTVAQAVIASVLSLVGVSGGTPT